MINQKQRIAIENATKGSRKLWKNGWGGEGRGSKLFPRLELVSITFCRPLTYFPKKQHQKHIWKSPWYVNILMQSVAQSKFPIDTRWMLYSIRGNFGVSSTQNLLCWRRIWSRPTKRWSFTIFSLRIMESSPAPTWIRSWKQKVMPTCLHALSKEFMG